jgi:hypothetical protein
MKQRRFTAGETIFQEGDPSDFAYLIWSGHVEVSKQTALGARRIAILAENDFLGEMGVIEDRPRSATAQALDDVVCSVIGKEEFVDQILNRPGEALDLLRVLFDRLRTMNDELARFQGSGAFEMAPDYHITLYPVTPEMERALPKQGYEVPRLPFRIGRKPSNRASVLLVVNELELPDGAAFVVAPNHLAIEREGNSLIVRDRGSKSGTLVGGEPLGAGAENLTVALAEGRTEIALGRFGSPYRMLAEVTVG